MSESITVTTYTPIHLYDRAMRLHGQPRIRLWRCDTCYALVDDREEDRIRHAQWHDGLLANLTHDYYEEDSPCPGS